MALGTSESHVHHRKVEGLAEATNLLVCDSHYFFLCFVIYYLYGGFLQIKHETMN